MSQQTTTRPADDAGHAPQLDGRTDEEMDAIYGRTAFARWSEPMNGDDLRDVLSEAFIFLGSLRDDLGFNATMREEYLMRIAQRVLWDLCEGKRTAERSVPRPCPLAGVGAL